MYALVVLVKMALLDNISAEPSSSITYQDVSKAGTYLNTCLDKMVEAAGMTDYRIPYLFPGMVIRPRKWYHYQLRRKHQSISSEDPCFTVFAGPDDHPALRATAEIAPPLPSATEDGAKTGQSPASGGLDLLSSGIFVAETVVHITVDDRRVW